MFASKMPPSRFWGIAAVALMVVSADAQPAATAPAAPKEPQAKIIVFEVRPSAHGNEGRLHPRVDDSLPPMIHLLSHFLKYLTILKHKMPGQSLLNVPGTLSFMHHGDVQMLDRKRQCHSHDSRWSNGLQDWQSLRQAWNACSGQQQQGQDMASLDAAAVEEGLVTPAQASTACSSLGNCQRLLGSILPGRCLPFVHAVELCEHSR